MRATAPASSREGRRANAPSSATFDIRDCTTPCGHYVATRLREDGPGWQTRANAALRRAVLGS